MVSPEHGMVNSMIVERRVWRDMANWSWSWWKSNFQILRAGLLFVGIRRRRPAGAVSASRSALLDHVVRGMKPAPTDPDLLAAFVERRDAEAFRRIVDR